MRKSYKTKYQNMLGSTPSSDIPIKAKPLYFFLPFSVLSKVSAPFLQHLIDSSLARPSLEVFSPPPFQANSPLMQCFLSPSPPSSLPHTIYLVLVSPSPSLLFSLSFPLSSFIMCSLSPSFHRLKVPTSFCATCFDTYAYNSKSSYTHTGFVEFHRYKT